MEIQATFEAFRKNYPGTKGGHQVEFGNFKKKHKDYAEVVNLLQPALDKLKAWRKKQEASGRFVPEYANLSTWVNQRRWEVELEGVVSGSAKLKRAVKAQPDYGNVLYDDGTTKAYHQDIIMKIHRGEVPLSDFDLPA